MPSLRRTPLPWVRSRHTGYAYDATGNLSQISHPDGAIQTYTYDALGRIAEMQEPTCRWTYRYDGLDRIVQTTQTTAAGRIDFDSVAAAHPHGITSFPGERQQT